MEQGHKKGKSVQVYRKKVRINLLYSSKNLHTYKVQAKQALMKYCVKGGKCLFYEAAVKAWKPHLTKFALILPGQQAANKKGRRIGGLRGSPLFVCLLLVLALKASFFCCFVRFFLLFFVLCFYDAICATTRKTRIVCADKLPPPRPTPHPNLTPPPCEPSAP